MSMRTIQAKTIKVGDVLASTLAHETMSVKQVQHRDLPTGGKEIVVIGPLSIMVKYHPDAKVKVYN